MSKDPTNHRPPSAICLLTAAFLMSASHVTQALGQVTHTPSLSADASEAGTSRQPLTRQDLNQALAVFDELDEQIRIAAAKLDPASLCRKEEIGKLRTMLEAIDEQIQLESTAVGRREERFRHLRQDLFASDQGSEMSSESNMLLEQSRAPIESAKARLERLTNYRVLTRQRLHSLQREHVRSLLAAIISPIEPASEADDFELFLEVTLDEPAPATLTNATADPAPAEQ